MAESLALPVIRLQQAHLHLVEKFRLFESPARRGELTWRGIAVQTVDDDVRAQQCQAPYEPRHGLLAGEQGHLPGQPLFFQGSSPADVEIVNFYAGHGKAVDNGQGLFEVRQGFAGQARDDVGADLQAPRSGLAGPFEETCRVVPAVDALQGAVVGRLQAKVQPYLVERRAAEDVQLPVVQAVWPGSDGDAGQVREPFEFPKHPEKSSARSVSIGEGLDVSQKTCRLPTGQDALPGGQVLLSQGQPAGQARAGAVSVAEDASAGGNAAIPVRAGTARVQWDLADPSAEAPAEICGE